MTQQNCEYNAEENLKHLTSGAVLLARTELEDPNFKAAVVLICVYSSDGVYGLVLNRPSHMPVSEIFDGFSGLNLVREIFVGGPVQQDELQILQITESPAEGAYQVASGLYVGGKWESTEQMFELNGDTSRLFLGYSGWGADQLENEIRAGAWDVYSLDLKRLIMDPPKKIICDRNQIMEYFREIKLD